MDITSIRFCNAWHITGGKRGLMGVWLQVQRCEGGASCDQSHLVKIVKLEHFYSALSSSLSLECGDWGVAGLYRLVVGVERDKERNITREDTILATSRTFIVDWSSDYSLSLHRTSLGDCPAGDFCCWKRIFSQSTGPLLPGIFIISCHEIYSLHTRKQFLIALINIGG